MSELGEIQKWKENYLPVNAELKNEEREKQEQSKDMKCGNLWKKMIDEDRNQVAVDKFRILLAVSCFLSSNGPMDPEHNLHLLLSLFHRLFAGRYEEDEKIMTATTV